jgi:hypothetical protein
LLSGVAWLIWNLNFISLWQRSFPGEFVWFSFSLRSPFHSCFFLICSPHVKFVWWFASRPNDNYENRSKNIMYNFWFWYELHKKTCLENFIGPWPIWIHLELLILLFSSFLQLCAMCFVQVLVSAGGVSGQRRVQLPPTSPHLVWVEFLRHQLLRYCA